MIALDASDIRARRGLRPAWLDAGSDAGGIAYLGASVTVQRVGYRQMLHERLTRLAGRNVTAINAGVGGVGSAACAFLIDDFVIRHRPSLCLVECTTGDMNGLSSLDDIRGAIDGILFKLRRAGIPACVMHLYRRDQSCDWSNPIIARYEEAAESFGVPSLNVGRALERAVQSGLVTADALLRDAVHTTPAGSDTTAELLAAGLETVLSQRPSGDPPPIPEAPRESYRHTRVLSAPSLVDREQYPVGLFRLVSPYLDLSDRHRLTFTPAEALKGLLVVVSPTSGGVGVAVNGDERAYLLHDPDTRYDRLSAVIFPEVIPAGVPAIITPRPTLQLLAFLTCARDEATDPMPAGDILTISS